MSNKDFQLLLWFLFFIISIILVGIAIYKKVKKQRLGQKPRNKKG
nr:hypothetical protein [Aerococcus tenax]MDL5179404.1 hypothetical protein [Aerococcus tenax]